MKAKKIAITPGAPEGIGAEIIQKSLREFSAKEKIILIAIADVIKQIVSDDPQLSTISTLLVEKGIEPSFNALQYAVELARRGEISAIVTAPINKKRWKEAGINFNGHTDYLATAFAVKQYAMLFYSPRLRVIPFTIHQPLCSIFNSIVQERIVGFLSFVYGEMKRLFKKEFRIYICGLNPHAGENGYIGHEEKEIILPALKKIQNEIDIAGIFPADAIFRRALEDPDHLVISWYHDQALIPFKLLSFEQGVNLTLGLPVVRTSPVHGTAEDIAGKGVAMHSSFSAALKLAEQLSTIG